MSLARQHVWVGPEATSFEADCEACQARRDGWSVSVHSAHVVGTLRREADVGFLTCRRGHRIVVHRVGRGAPRFPHAAMQPVAGGERGPWFAQ
jgi:hypothetical protein